MFNVVLNGVFNVVFVVTCVLNRYCVPEGSYTFALDDTALEASRNKHAMVQFSYQTSSGATVSVDLTGTETVANFDIDTGSNDDDDDDKAWYEVAGIVVAIVIAIVVLIYGGCVW